MKKRIVFTALCSLLTYATFCQINLTQFNQVRLKTNQTGLMILGTWAIGNIAIGASLMSNRMGEDKYFHQMNLGWGAVNLALAGVGYYVASKADPASFDLHQTIQEQHSIQKILLLNVGLDVGYMLGGAYMMERAKNITERPERMRGFGKSIILQGAFLFLFDIGFYLAHAQHNEALKPLLEGLSFTGNGVRFSYVF